MKSINNYWHEFERAMVDKDASLNEQFHIKNAFFAGALAVTAIQQEIAKNTTNEKDSVAAMNKIKADVVDNFADVFAVLSKFFNTLH